MPSHHNEAERFAEVMREAGADVRVSYAQTGTVYVTVDCWSARFADHHDAYATSFVTVSPDGITIAAAVIAMAEELDLPVPPRRLAAFRAAETRRQRAWEAKLQERIERDRRAREAWENGGKQRAAARAAFIADYLERLDPPLEARSKTGRKKARAKAAKAWCAA